MSSHMLWSANIAINAANIYCAFPCDSGSQPFWGRRDFIASGLPLLLLSNLSKCCDPTMICLSDPTLTIFQQIQGILKGWSESSDHSTRCLQELLMVLCLLAKKKKKKKLKWGQVRREKHNFTHTMRYCICFQVYCSKLSSKLRNPTSDHWEMKSEVYIHQNRGV